MKEHRPMRFLASRRWRIFLTAWILYSVHFATNVVREHYPAFSLAEHGTFQVDEYQGFHADIFVHRDGHSYVGNNVIVSVLAAVPLFVFDPVLDALEDRGKQNLTHGNGKPASAYRTDKPNRRAFFRLVKERGLELRFGAATVITTAFFMAPLTALFVVLMFNLLRRRQVEADSATWLALLFAFGTPVFFRTAHLNHNMFLMYAMFLAFILLWIPPGEHLPVSQKRRLLAGFLAGFSLAADYIGVIVIALLYGYLVLTRLSSTSWRTSLRESLAFVVGSVPPVLFLIYSQWAMYGNPFLPGQYWMPEQNIYTGEGWRGLDWPSLDLFQLNLFDPSYGLYIYGPLLLLGLVPAIYHHTKLILPRRERLFVIACFAAFLTFCAANQYSRLQFNSGVRYLIPLVPFIFLASCDHLLRLPKVWKISITVLAILHSWVTTVFREPIPEAWALFLENGVQVPWLMVLRQTSTSGRSILWHPLLPGVILGVTLLLLLGLWTYGARLETQGQRRDAIG